MPDENVTLSTIDQSLIIVLPQPTDENQEEYIVYDNSVIPSTIDQSLHIVLPQSGENVEEQYIDVNSSTQ